MDKENRQQHIERFLRGGLSAEEQKAFEEAMAQDEELAEEVALQALIRDELSDQSKQDFLRELDTLSEEFFGSAAASEQEEESKRQKNNGAWKYGAGSTI